MSDNLSDQDAEDDAKEKLLGFYGEDRHFLLELKRAIRKLIHRSDTTPEQIYHLAKLLLALDRLPRPTRGLALELSLGLEHANGEKSCQDLYVDETSFRVGNSAWIITDPAVGGDSRSDTILDVEIGGYRELLHPTAFADWVAEFARRVADSDQKLGISDLKSGSEIDWQAEADESDWEKLGSDYL
jgi:hypothetical protein